MDQEPLHYILYGTTSRAGRSLRRTIDDRVWYPAPSNTDEVEQDELLGVLIYLSLQSSDYETADEADYLELEIGYL